ncbi:MAG: hypothetical protein BM556_16815 [Bacteriovorax sp. MedPE-SWde]|nr:MAG: hypothetical protein BM556_16815 [Bacteriovorax sp. MedPE-SWde]
MKKLFGILLSVLMITSCSTTTTKNKAYSKMYTEKPTSITVLPVVNNSTAADAPLLYLSTVAEPLANNGYYVFPIEITNQMFTKEGITSGRQLESVPIKKYGEMFGTDSVLSVTINKWDTNYIVIAGDVTVELETKIMSTRTGETLWSQKRTLSVPTQQQSSGFILVDLITTAISTAMTDYIPVARRLNQIVFSTVPAGKYSVKHGKDGDQVIHITK